MRRRRWSPSYSGQPYSSNRHAGIQVNNLTSRIPTILILASFLTGMLLGRHPLAQTNVEEITRKSTQHFRSIGNSFLQFLGLSVRNECVSEDGSETVAFCSVSQLFGKLAREKVILESRMESTKEYGSFYRRIFNDVSTKSSVPIGMSGYNTLQRQKKQTPLFLSSTDSTNRLIRRILIKHLQAVLREQNLSSKNNEPPPTFTWYTAGDATAAGHGNLFKQGYTEILQDTVQNAFQALGVNFIAKNYGMGQYSSGPELAVCMNEIFGCDIDILMWDFSSLQEQPLRHTVLWGNRAAMHQSRPILFYFDSFGDHFLKLNELESSMGMGSVLMDATSMQKLRERLPDSSSVDNPKDLPDALRYYFCDGTVEGSIRCDDPMRNFVCYIDDEMDATNVKLGSPKVCQENKFRTTPDCLDARYQVSWLPGWKDHKLKGRLLGLFLVNMLNEAMFELGRLQNLLGNDATTILNRLKRLEARDKRLYSDQNPDTNEWKGYGVNPRVILRGESICHTALFPSKSRIEGITTQSDMVGDERNGFYKGFNQFLMKTPDDGLLPLAFDMNDRQQCDLLEIDHKDFFLVREQDGWVSTIVPNDRELEAYKRSTTVQGIIVICLKICPLDKCPDAYVSLEWIRRRTKLFISVDGKIVTDVRKFDGSCNILVGEQGMYWGKKDQFELKLRINDPGTLHVLKISSIIVF